MERARDGKEIDGEGEEGVGRGRGKENGI